MTERYVRMDAETFIKTFETTYLVHFSETNKDTPYLNHMQYRDAAEILLNLGTAYKNLAARYRREIDHAEEQQHNERFLIREEKHLGKREIDSAALLRLCPDLFRHFGKIPATFIKSKLNEQDIYRVLKENGVSSAEIEQHMTVPLTPVEPYLDTPTSKACIKRPEIITDRVVFANGSDFEEE